MVEIPKGYSFSATHCGIKKDKNLFDLGIIFSSVPAICSAAFTKNLLKSNSIVVSQKNLQQTITVKCIIANSGCANTATGSTGVKDTFEICKYTSRKLDIKPEEVVIASTGVIGEPLPKRRIFSGIDILTENIKKLKSINYIDFAKSIMTTDTKEKIVSDTLHVDGEKITVLCIGKGAGMISPDLKLHATMLVFFLTDVYISKFLLDQVMKSTVVPQFNSFSIDGDTSPNDTIFFLANGVRKNSCLSKSEYEKFSTLVEKVSQEMVKQLLFDGEGVTKVVKITFKNTSYFKAEQMFKTISSSLLVKTAIYGADPNWGRILSCCGRSRVKINMNKLNLWIGKYQVVKNGENNFVSDSLVRKTMQKKFYEITIDVSEDKRYPEYSFFTTDLSKKYVEINSQYKT